MNLCDLYRAGDVIRWQIVKTVRPQSIAEHSFGVAMITMKLRVEIDMPDAFEHIAMTWALWHDLPEIFTGDIATPLKKHIRGHCVTEPFSVFENGVCGEDYKLIYKMAHETFPEIAAVVKLADLIESIKFLSQNAVTEHGEKVKTNLRTTFHTKITEFINSYPQYGWKKTHHIYDEIFDIETHLDDLV